jgi:hypothetical protein
MSLCPAGQKTTIEWQYTGEEKQRIEGADSYTTELLQNIALNTSYQLVYRQPIISGGQLQGWNSNESTTSLGTFNGISNWRMRFVLNGGAVVLTNPFCTFFNGDPGISNRQCQIYCDITSQGITTNKLIGSSFGSWGLRVQPSNAALRSQSCYFKVFKNGAVVYQRSESTCPTVTYFCGDQCPEGTCQCDCGTEICCYDTTTGKAVKSFKK